MPGVYDSSGVLRGLVIKWGQQWVPLIQTSPLKKDKHEHHWVVGFGEKDISCIVTRGTEHPAIFPHPVITCFPLRIPLSNLDSHLGPHEEEYGASF